MEDRAAANFQASMNCAQAVWAARFPDDASTLALLGGAGGGRADNGYCGALHAALSLIDPSRQDMVKNQFRDQTGSTRCREIRSARTVSCAECVRIAAGLAAPHVQEETHP